MLFSIGFFVIGLLNWLNLNPNVDLSFLYVNTLNNYHALEICLVIGAVVSIIQNYKRAKTTKTKRIFDKTFYLFSFDYVIMLFGAFASQMVYLTFSFSNDGIMHLVVGSYGFVIICANIFRKRILNFFANQIH